MQSSGEQIILAQAEKYEKLIAELEAQVEANKKAIAEQFADADKLAEESAHSDTIWMRKRFLFFRVDCAHLFLPQ